jgi:hypothetical protein
MGLLMVALMVLVAAKLFAVVVAVAVAAWLLYQSRDAHRVVTGHVVYATSTNFKVAIAGVVATLVALHATWR